MAAQGSDWGHQAGAFRDDPMAVMVGVAGEGDVEAILQADKALHRVGEEGSMRIRPSNPGS